MRLFRPARLTAVAAAALLSVGLSACSSGESPEPEAPPESTPQAAPEPSRSASPTATSSPAVPSTTDASPTQTPTSGTATSTSRPGLPEDVAEVREIFSSVAPDSLFEEFASCNASGISNAWECSGREVGQFQFFESMAKAASTTQLITELRSSRVVEDTGRTVVGWSTLGTTAVITVVDNDKGLVMQQMVSSDRVDPEERIYELGLARPAESTSATTEPDSGD